MTDYVCACGVPMQTNKCRLGYAHVISIYKPGVLCWDLIYHFVNPWLSSSKSLIPMVPGLIKNHFLDYPGQSG